LQAVNHAAMSIAFGAENVQIAGGVEHMDHIPMEAGVDPSPRYLYRHSLATLQMGVTAEGLAIRYKISRREQDEWSLRSHQRASEASDAGAFTREIIPTWGRDEEGRRRLLTRDQCVRKVVSGGVSGESLTSLEALAALEPSFMPEGGTITAGNSSPLNVGAAALLVMSEDRAKELNLKPMAKVRAMAVAGVDPTVMGIGPVPATQKALQRAGLKLEDIDLIEINEAFAAQTLSVIKLLKADPEKINVRGGAIAIGHPIGASGARISTTLLHTMRDKGARLGLATMCIGAGQGIATIYEAI
jgi:acetyl-CoA acyltransferase